MKIKVLKKINGSGDESNQVLVDGRKVATVYPLWECPEDAIIGRDLISGGEIANYIKMGFEAGKRGEEIEIVEEIVDDFI